MKEAVREFYGADAQPFPPLAAVTNVNVPAPPIDVQSLIVLAIGVVAVVALQVFLFRTCTGRCMQATAQNPTVARLLGIPIERMILYTFVINGALVTLASILMTPIYLAEVHQRRVARPLCLHRGHRRRLNQIRGAIVGGLLLGVVDNFAAAYLSSQYRNANPLLTPDLVILSGRRVCSVGSRSERYQPSRLARGRRAKDSSARSW